MNRGVWEGVGYPEVFGTKQVTNTQRYLGLNKLPIFVGEPGLITGSSLGLISSVTMEMNLMQL